MSRFKRITEYTTQELNAAIADAQSAMGGADHFWTVLKGFDSYFEKRRRKLEEEGEESSPSKNDVSDT